MFTETKVVDRGFISILYVLYHDPSYTIRVISYGKILYNREHFFI